VRVPSVLKAQMQKAVTDTASTLHGLNVQHLAKKAVQEAAQEAVKEMAAARTPTSTRDTFSKD
jgi:hypothetical protein